MGRPTYTFVCPTKNRQKLACNFARSSLSLLGERTQVIVSDNSDDEIDRSELSDLCANIGVEYVRPRRRLSMTENWNFALEHARGDYVGFFTDKMVPISSTLHSVFDFVESEGNSRDIVSWNANAFTPERSDVPLGPGTYTRLRAHVPTIEPFDPKDVLRTKLRNVTHRSEETMSEYAKGKICFGMYSRALISRAKDKYGALFHPFAPDYTSASIGLSLADSALHFHIPCACQINLPISNGALFAARDDHARLFMESQPGSNMADLPVPGLYSSISNLVAHDWASALRLSGVLDGVDLNDWIKPIFNEVMDSRRVWSSEANYQEQTALLELALNRIKSPDLEAKLVALTQHQPKIRGRDLKSEETSTERDYLILFRHLYRRAFLRKINVRLASFSEVQEIATHLA